MAEYGPCLPPHLQEDVKPEQTSAARDASQEEEDLSFGPALPPGLQMKKQEDRGAQALGPTICPSIGPSLPPHLQELCGPSEEDGNDETATPEQQDEDRYLPDDTIGPLPGQSAWSEEEEAEARRVRFEARANNMKKQLDPNNAQPDIAREEWMMALPSTKKMGLGLTARKFKSSSSYVTNEDRSVWTDTPADRERKMQQQKEKKDKQDVEVIPESVRRRDEELASQVDEYNKLHRDQSLLEVHRQKRKAESSSDGAKKPAYEPWDHDRDMGEIRRTMDPSAKRKVLANAKKLDSRFAHSSQGRFL